MTIAAPEQARGRRDAVRRRLLPFTGLIPVVGMVPVLALDAYGLAIVLTLVSGAGVIAYHLSRDQGVTSLDLMLVGFGVVNAILYFGFDNAVLLDHIDAVIYTVLAVQAAWSLFRDPPWTGQFTKRTVAPEAWELSEFRAVNRIATAIWAACFAACDVIALTAPQPWRLYAPVVVMLFTAVASRRLSRLYLARVLGVPANALPAPWS